MSIISNSLRTYRHKKIWWRQNRKTKTMDSPRFYPTVVQHTQHDQPCSDFFLHGHHQAVTFAGVSVVALISTIPEPASDLLSPPILISSKVSMTSKNSSSAPTLPPEVFFDISLLLPPVAARWCSFINSIPPWMRKWRRLSKPYFVYCVLRVAKTRFIGKGMRQYSTSVWELNLIQTFRGIIQLFSLKFWLSFLYNTSFCENWYCNSSGRFQKS